MRQGCWSTWPDRGFLIHPDPIGKLTEAAPPGFPIPAATLTQLESLAADLPHLLETRQARKILNEFPVIDVTVLPEMPGALDFRIVERLMHLYSMFASGYVFAAGEALVNCLPASIAVPLYHLSQMVERPPMMSYASGALANWRRIDPEGGIELDNLAALNTLMPLGDEAWFFMVHVDIEARGAEAVCGIGAAAEAAVENDAASVEEAFGAISRSLAAMIRTFGRITQGCDPDVYYVRVRPYMFSFEKIIYEGVEAYHGQPQSFRGGSAAQSSIVPALVAGLELRHEQNSLTSHLEVMQSYMPKPHREFLRRMRESTVRDFVFRNRDNSALGEGYNECLRRLMSFRKLHFHFVNEYIFKKDPNPVGTGGTMFMDWLSRLIAETEEQLIKPSLR